MVITWYDTMVKRYSTIRRNVCECEGSMHLGYSTVACRRLTQLTQLIVGRENGGLHAKGAWGLLAKNLTLLLAAVLCGADMRPLIAFKGLLSPAPILGNAAPAS